MSLPPEKGYRQPSLTLMPVHCDSCCNVKIIVVFWAKRTGILYNSCSCGRHEAASRKHPDTLRPQSALVMILNTSTTFILHYIAERSSGVSLSNLPPFDDSFAVNGRLRFVASYS